MPQFSLTKSEKLCSRTAINELFASGASAMAYPVRMVCRESRRNYGATVQFMLTVPKKNMRHAVDRVLLRRRMREAYRLNRSCIDARIAESGKRVDVAFIYSSKEKCSYERIERKMQKLLASIATLIGMTDEETA